MDTESLRVLIQQFKDAMIVLNKEFVVEFLNEQALRQLKIDRKKLQGKVCHQVFYKRKKPCSNCPVLTIESGEMAADCMGCLRNIGIQKIELPAGRMALLTFSEIPGSIETTGEKPEAYLQSIFRVAPIGIGVVINRIFSFVNNRLCQMTGYTAKEMLGQSARLLYPDDDEFSRVGDIKYRQIAVDGTGTIETRWKCKDGSIKDILLSSTPLDPENLSKGVTFTALDISARKRFEEKYLRSEFKYKTVIETATDPVVIAEADTGIIIDVNAKTLELLGKTREALLGEKNLTLHPAELREEIRRKFTVVSKGEPLVVQTEVLHSSGGRIPVEIYPSHFSDEEGRILVMGFFRDLRQREKWKNALQESEQRYEVLFETVKEGILLVDPDTSRFSYVNPAMCDFLKYTKEEFVRLKTRDIHPEKAFPKIRDKFNQSLEGRQPTIRNVPCLTKDRKVVYADIHGTYTTIGGHKYITAFFNDATERKLREQQLRKINRELKESENNYRKLFDEMASGFAVHEMLYDKKGKAIDYRFLEVNTAFEKLTGLKAEKVMNKTLSEALPGIEDVWIKEYAKVVRTGKPITFIQYSDNLRKHFEVLAYSPQKNHFATIFNDVTDRVKTLKRLAESEERYRKLIDSSPNIILVFRKDEILFANSMALSASGYTSLEDLQKREAHSIIHPGDRDLFQQRIQKEEAGIKNKPTELRLRKKDGSVILAESISIPIVYEDKKASLHILTDITERRKAEYAAVEIENIIKDIQKGIASKVGEKFFETIVMKLAGILKADYAFIGEISQSRPDAVKTISFYDQGRIGLNFMYDLRFTPLSENRQTEICMIPQEVDKLFPKDEFISNMKINGYAGMSLYNSKGDRVGIMVAMFRKAIQKPDLATTILDIFSARGGVEIERMKAERALAKAHETFRTIALNLPDIILRIDRNLKCMFVSPGIEEYTHIKADRFIGHKLTELDLDSEFVLNRENEFRNVLKTKKTYQTITSLRMGKGSRILEWRMHPELGDKGEVDSILNIIRDLTETKRTETQLNQLFSLSADLICIVSKNGPFLRVNPAWENVLGYTQQELLEIPFFDLIHQDDLISTYQIIADRIEKNELVYNFENRCRCKDGSYKWLSWVTQSFGDEDLLFGIARDVTEQRVMVDELIKAKEKAEESDKLKSAFVANMSHEIRTPMNAIIGFSSLLGREDMSPEKRRYYADIIQSRSEDLLSIIDDILDISKIESNQIQIINEEFSLNELLFELQEDFRQKLRTIPNKAIEFRLGKRADPALDRICNDRLRIKQVMTNLIDNAIKFTNKGWVTYGCVFQKKTVQFYVSDTGIGIPRQLQERIFERFRQGEESMTRKYGGNGLGLSISKALVELMGGEIWLDSLKGTGTTFYFNIPDLGEDKAVPPADVKKVGIGLDLKNRSILIVEDEPLSREYLSILLRQVGANVHLARNGNEALSIYENEGIIDLVLMDIHLPDIDGYLVTKRLKSLDPEVLIIAQTAFAMSEDRQKCLAAGCIDYLSKPVKIDDLMETIRKIIPKMRST